MMKNDHNKLEIDRCPWCQTNKPHLAFMWNTTSQDHTATIFRTWVVYGCQSCGGVVLTRSKGKDRGVIEQMFPEIQAVSGDIPQRAREYLEQAGNSLHAPAGAVILAASSIDSMLKAKGLRDGHLNDRIKKAAEDHLITDEMAAWAHDVRLDANDQRHADDSAPLPNQADAEKVILFAKALGEFLFVLPAKVQRGRAAV